MLGWLSIFNLINRSSWKEPPALSEIWDLAAYVNSEIARVADFSNGSLPVFYLVDGSYGYRERRIIKTIDRLVDKLGLDVIGVSSISGEINTDTVNEGLLPEYSALYDKANEGGLLNFMRERKLGILKYALDHYPVSLLGLEDKALHKELQLREDIKITLLDVYSSVHEEMFYIGNPLGPSMAILAEETEHIYREWFVPTRLEDEQNLALFRAELKEALEQSLSPLLAELPTPMQFSDIEHEFDNIRFDTDPAKIPFYVAMDTHSKRINSLRSSIAANIAQTYCQERDKQQMALVLATGLVEPVQAELGSMGLSYIILG